jgi:hypothetical protein
VFFIHFVLRTGLNWYRSKWLKNGKLRSAILSAFYNISQRNFGILLILRCSFDLWYLDLSRSKFCSLGNRSPMMRSGAGKHCIRLFGEAFDQEIQVFINHQCNRWNWWFIDLTMKYAHMFCSYLNNLIGPF